MVVEPPGWRGSLTRRESPSLNSAFEEPDDARDWSLRSAYWGSDRSISRRTK